MFDAQIELLVDMLNDEINEVRVNTIQSVGKILADSSYSLNEDPPGPPLSPAAS